MLQLEATVQRLAGSQSVHDPPRTQQSITQQQTMSAGGAPATEIPASPETQNPALQRTTPEPLQQTNTNVVQPNSLQASYHPESGMDEGH